MPAECRVPSGGEVGRPKPTECRVPLGLKRLGDPERGEAQGVQSALGMQRLGDPNPQSAGVLLGVKRLGDPSRQSVGKLLTREGRGLRVVFVGVLGR